MTNYDAWKSSTPTLTMPRCPACDEPVMVGLVPSGPLRMVFPALDCEDLFCDTECLAAWIADHADSAADQGEAACWDDGRVEVLA